MRPRTKGPRSLTRTVSARPFSRLVTRTIDGMGRVRCAAETAFMSKNSPFAVRLPWNFGPYQDAIPISSYSSSIAGR